MKTYGKHMAGRTALVTGAYGLIGGWLVDRLLSLNAHVVVLRRDRVRSSLLELSGQDKRCNVVHGDVLDPDLVMRVIAEYDCDTVFHLAGQPIIARARDLAVQTFDANVRGTWIVMDVCRRLDVQRVIVASSINAYGPGGDVPYSESQPLRPVHPYEVSKACADLVALSYWHTYGVPVATTRLSSVYGGGDFNGSRLIPETIAAVLEDRAPGIRSNGAPERDFLFVDDAVDAYLAIVDALDADEGSSVAPVARGQAFNAGGGSPRRIVDVVNAVCALVGPHLKADVQGSGVAEGGVDRQRVDSSKLREATGWRPQVSLEDGLERTLAWYRSHHQTVGRS
jgi:CDP-glucose 4,6-dehydratase